MNLLTLSMQITHTHTQHNTTAPLWIDPKSPKSCQALKFLIFLVPLVIFVISVYLISYSWNIMENDEIEGIFIGNNINNQVIYVVLYMFSLIFLSLDIGAYLKKYIITIVYRNEKG